MSKLNFFAPGYSAAVNAANKKELPKEVQKNEDKYKGKGKK